jgi:uncharacterized protein
MNLAIKHQPITFTNSHGDKLVGRLTNPTNDLHAPLIIWCYGHSSYMDRPSSQIMVKTLLDHYWSVFQFDFYGHGDSEGDFANATPSEAMDDVLQAIKYVKSLGYTRIGLVGSSFGGLACLLAAADTKDIFVLALKSPVSDYAALFPTEIIPEWQQTGSIPYPEKPQTHKLNYLFYSDSLEHNAYQVAHQIHVPTLIVHGDADTEVPLSQSRKLAQLIPNCHLEIIPGADHNYSQPDHERQMLSAISQFILDHINH